MGQEFADFADVGGLAGFVEKIEKFLQGIGVVADVPDDGVQALENFVRIFRQEALGVLIENLESALVLASLHQGVGERRDRWQIVVNGQQLVRDATCLGKLA